MSGLLHLVEAATALTRLPVGPANSLSSTEEVPTTTATLTSPASTGVGSAAPMSAKQDLHLRTIFSHAISDDDAEALSGAPAALACSKMAALRENHLQALRAAAADAGLVATAPAPLYHGYSENQEEPLHVATPASVHQVSSPQSANSTRILRCGATSSAPGGGGSDPKEAFPARLHSLLSDPTVHDVISWLPHGKSFVVLRPDVFATRVLPRYFAPEGSNSLNAKTVTVVGKDGSLQARNGSQGVHKYPSFTRKLNRWGFRQISRGPDAGAFCHELFQRDAPDLCRGMVCQKSRKSKKMHMPGLANMSDDTISISSASTMGTKLSASSEEKRPYSSTVTVSTAGASATNKTLPFKKRKSGQHIGNFKTNDIPSMISHRIIQKGTSSGTSSESDLTSDGGSVCSANVQPKVPMAAAVASIMPAPNPAATVEAAAKEALARHFHEQHRAFALASLMENSRMAMEAAGISGQDCQAPTALTSPAAACTPSSTPANRRLPPVLGAITTHSQGVFAPTVSLPEVKESSANTTSMAEAAKSALYSAYLQALSNAASPPL